MLFAKNPSPPDGGAAARHIIDSAAFSPFWGVVLSEIAAMASPEQLYGFFLGVGRRMAELHSVGGVQHLDRLSDRINGFWDSLGWGQVSFELDDEGMDIIHIGVPGSLEGDRSGVWPQIAPAVLEGAYDAWFRQMGSADRLHTRVVAASEGRVDLRHGL
ncbi:MAG: cellulose biosynthesis protein BcsD [Sphingobium sp.]